MEKGVYLDRKTQEAIKMHDPKHVFADTPSEREHKIYAQSRMTEDDTQMSQLIDRWVTNSFQG